MLKMDKDTVAKALEDMASLLEFQGENPFKVRAYVNAARALFNLDEDFEKMIEEDRLKELEGIGERLSEKIKILATTGSHPIYKELKKSVPQGFFELSRIPGLGTKKIMVLYKKLKIESIQALKDACNQGKISKIRGFGEKTQTKILEGIAHLETYSQRFIWWDAMEIAMPILEGLRNCKGVKKAEVAGSLRRKLETVGDLDFVVATSNPRPVMDWFIHQLAVELVITHGPTKSSVRLSKGIQAELRIVPPKEFGFVLLYSTGSKNHSIKLRRHALEKGLSISEYGIKPVSPEILNPFAQNKKEITEESIYKALGMDYIPPELREDTGEIEAALKGTLPHLINEEDLRGTFHVHTSESDGRASLEEMIKAGQSKGWEYIGISDHSKSSFQANGLSEGDLLDQVKRIRKLNLSKRYKIHVFAGVECDILSTGRLDFSGDILKELDYVIVSIHSSMHQDEKTSTKRLIRAIENPYTTIVGHVTGRLLLKREGYPLDMQKVIDACIANGKIMEINGNPRRMEMDWRYWHKAADKGLLCSINTDAHDRDNLDFVKTGINVARKGWLEKDQVINTYPLSKLKKLLSSFHPQGV